MPDVTRDADRPQTQSATYGTIEVRAPEGELDEVVGEGFLHLEQMSYGHWWFSFTDKDGHVIHCNLWGTGRIVRTDDDPEYEVVGRVEYDGQTTPATEPAEGRELPTDDGLWLHPTGWALMERKYDDQPSTGAWKSQLSAAAWKFDHMQSVSLGWFDAIDDDFPRGSWHKAASGDELTALRSQLAGVQGALMDAGDVLDIRTDGDYGASVREVVEQRDAAREDVAHLALLRNDMLKALTARDEEVRRLRGALNDLAIQPEYDCPGDTPEICGYLCLICRGLGSIEGDVEHAPDCALASPPPPRTITEPPK